jgi:D-lyxose ketol-isomerase
MKRSQINAAIELAHKALAQHGIRLPEWGYWPAARWKEAGPEMSRITRNALGWACTDFGQGDFDNVGITMFDVRNGTREFPDQGTPYGEKIYVLKPGQRLPYHFHHNKVEDIISYNGGTLMIQLFNSRPDQSMDEESAGTVYCDGVEKRFDAGQVERAERHGDRERQRHVDAADPGQPGEVKAAGEDERRQDPGERKAAAAPQEVQEQHAAQRTQRRG